MPHQKLLHRKSLLFLPTAATFSLLRVTQDTFYPLGSWCKKLGTSSQDSMQLVSSVQCPSPPPNHVQRRAKITTALALVCAQVTQRKSISALACTWVLLCSSLCGYRWGLSQMQAWQQQGEDGGQVKSSPSTPQLTPEVTKEVVRGRPVLTDWAVKQPLPQGNNWVPSQAVSPGATPEMKHNCKHLCLAVTRGVWTPLLST